MIADILYGLPFLGEGLLITVHVSALVVVIATGLGLMGGVAIAYGPFWVFWPSRIYVDIVRGIPVLVLIFSVYYGLPPLGININNFYAAVAALSGFMAAHIAEVTRGAIQSVSPGQMDAGKAIGLTFVQRVAYVILPQAVRRFLPPWVNMVAEIVKGSTLISLVGVVDLMLAAQQVIGRTYRPMPMYLTGAAMYFLINYALSATSRRLEASFAHIRE